MSDFYDYEKRYRFGNSELYTQLELLEALLAGGKDEDMHYCNWVGSLDEDESPVKLTQDLIDNLTNPSQEFLTILLPMLKIHAEECLKDFKKDLIKDVIK